MQSQMRTISVRKGLKAPSSAQFVALPLVKLMLRSERAVLTVVTWFLLNLPNNKTLGTQFNLTSSRAIKNFNLQKLCSRKLFIPSNYLPIQMKGTEQYFPVVLFVILIYCCKVK